MFLPMADDSNELDALKRELEATREELKKYQFLLDLVPFYVAYVDGNWTYQLHNAHAADWFASHEDLPGRPLAEVLGVDAFDDLAEDILNALAGNSVGYERRVRFLGRDFHVRADYTPHIVDGEVRGVGAVIENMSVRRSNEERLRRASVVFDVSRDAIIIFDSKHRIVQVNAAFCELTGYTPVEVQGERPIDFTVPMRGSDLARVWDTMIRDGHWAGELYFRHKDGSVRHVWVTVSCVTDDTGFVHNYVAVMTSMDASTTLSHLAHHDALTGLPNRLLLQARMEHTLERAQRQARPAAVMYIDLDRFKPINDEFGHAQGDAVLIEIGRRLSAVVRAQDTVARLGGDEFVVLLDEYAKTSDVQAVAERVLDALSQPLTIAGRDIPVGGSVGVAVYPEDARTADELLKCADQAMYEAKLAGRGVVHRYGNDAPRVS